MDVGKGVANAGSCLIPMKNIVSQNQFFFHSPLDIENFVLLRALLWMLLRALLRR